VRTPPDGCRGKTNSNAWFTPAVSRYHWSNSVFPVRDGSEIEPVLEANTGLRSGPNVAATSPVARPLL
jgi:hypothetical protein